MAQHTGLNENSSMSQEKARKIHSIGGKASHSATTSSYHTTGAAGNTEAAKRGGQHGS
jgi:hypothetical protein